MQEQLAGDIKAVSERVTATARTVLTLGEVEESPTVHFCMLKGLQESMVDRSAAVAELESRVSAQVFSMDIRNDV